MRERTSAGPEQLVQLEICSEVDGLPANRPSEERLTLGHNTLASARAARRASIAQTLSSGLRWDVFQRPCSVLLRHDTRRPRIRRLHVAHRQVPPPPSDVSSGSWRLSIKE
jgi:hypothetical protein